eukprot:gb/GECG01003003.1/.p1 GENE.gb/GECG01003003.1/~~gb/GECG01003003.1/.p1  ORF type:complete len:175 (+),score=15.61 gb/GECG01003003.1/:1-525(+)
MEGATFSTAAATVDPNFFAVHEYSTERLRNWRKAAINGVPVGIKSSSGLNLTNLGPESVEQDPFKRMHRFAAGLNFSTATYADAVKYFSTDRCPLPPSCISDETKELQETNARLATIAEDMGTMQESCSLWQCVACSLGTEVSLECYMRHNRKMLGRFGKVHTVRYRVVADCLR